MDKTPLWLKALPPEFQGGPESATQKRRKEMTVTGITAMAIAPLSAKMFSTEYTGKDSNDKVTADKVASKTMMKDHLGEMRVNLAKR